MANSYIDLARQLKQALDEGTLTQEKYDDQLDKLLEMSLPRRSRGAPRGGRRTRKKVS